MNPSAIAKIPYSCVPRLRTRTGVAINPRAIGNNHASTLKNELVARLRRRGWSAPLLIQVPPHTPRSRFGPHRVHRNSGPHARGPREPNACEGQDHVLASGSRRLVLL